MNRQPIWICFVLLFVVCLFSHSCVIRIVDKYDNRGLIPIEDYQRNIRFSPGGMISLRNFDGIIEVTGWDQNEVQIYAEKMSPRSEGSSIRFALPKHDIAHIELEKYGEENIYINTKSTSREGEDTIVDYYIKTPRLVYIKEILARNGDVFIADVYGSVSVKLEKGTIKVDNFSGSLDASVLEGSISTRFFDLRKEDVITLNSQQGDIVVQLQKSVNARIKALYPQGEFVTEFDLSHQESKEDNQVDMKLGEGGASLYITAHNGDIEVKIIESMENDS
ncbi:MAG: DUF4097 family beta strand repeat protein [Candidatus Aminicenantes bacterium]|nr:DUF4097 family beta strand repeat protein [Candidatus Aminicenantes bacterium]